MSGSKYETAMEQMENQETLNPDTPIFHPDSRRTTNGSVNYIDVDFTQGRSK